MNSSMMQFDGVAAIFAVIAVLCLLAGYKLLSSSSWVGGWLRGNLGILCILLTGFLVLCVIDVRSYKPMFDDKTVATLSFRVISPSHYEARVVDATGVESRYSVAGDSWYLSANRFKWSKRMSLGMGHGYRFNTLVGIDKTNGSKTFDTVFQSHYFDAWDFMNKHAANTFLVSTDVVATEPQPLADAAMYEVVPSGFDLIVKPLNEFAKHAQAASMQNDLAASSTISTDSTTSSTISSPSVNVAIPAATTNAAANVATSEVAPASQSQAVTTH
jgi:hypothetical protein